MQANYKAAFPRRTAPCLCGSGERFKNCCSRALDAHFNNGREWPQGPVITTKARIAKARYEIAKYRVWHIAHTKTGLSFPLPAGVSDQYLVDIRALSDYLERLLWLYAQTNRTSAIQQTIQAFSKAIDDPRWSNRIRYLEVLWQHYESWSEEEIDVALLQFDIDSIRDPDILQLYLDVKGKSIGLAKYRTFCDIIVSETLEPEHRLQYRFLAALQLDLHGDHQAAIEEVNVALSNFEEESDKASLGAYGHLQYCRVLTRKAAWSNDTTERAMLIDKAVASCSAALSSGELNLSGRAHMLLEKGEALAVGRRWQEASETARQSAALEPSFLATLLEVRGALELKQYGLAHKLLNRYNYVELSPDNQLDHSLSLAQIACATDDISLCETVLDRLRKVATPYPYFRERIAALIAQLADQKLVTLSHDLQEMHRIVAEGFDPLRLTDTQIRSVLAHHLSLSPCRQARTLPAGLELPVMLSEVLQTLCRVLLDQRALLTKEMRSQEDTYTAFITVQLTARLASLGWQVSFQDYGGRPAAGSVEFGRRDITIRKDDDAPFAIIEAVRCDATTPSTCKVLLEHIERLLERYDTSRSAELFTIVFVRNAPLEQFTSWYCECFSTSVTLEPDVVPTPPSSLLRLLHGKHYTQWGPRLVKHILMDAGTFTST